MWNASCHYVFCLRCFANFSAEQIFSYPAHRTWEFTSDHPIRSVFPLWPVYNLPMILLKWVWADDAGNVSPRVIYYSLRAVMFMLSFVLEDWAIYELVHSPRQRGQAVLLVVSSYVTWTFQTHTISNSVETLVVAWSLVLIQRISESQVWKTSFMEYAFYANGLDPEDLHLPLRHSILPGRFRHFQPHHVSCFSLDTRPAFAATFPAEVSPPQP